MKKKVGILTFQRTTNYGAQFQNYALQEHLKQFNNLQVDVINYENVQINNTEKQKKLSQLHGVKQIVKYILIGNKKKKKWDKFENFRKEHIYLTKEYTKDNIGEIQNYYDYFLVGSDQVWNTDITGNDYNYMLDFVTDDRKKYSYAASIGKEEVSDESISKIKKFKKVNVRENSAKKLLEKKGIQNVTTVVDPVFLMNDKEWIEKLNIKASKSNYIFVYMIDNVKENMKKIKKLAKEENLKVIYINNNILNVLGVKNVRDASPTDFLNYLYGAKYVITGSFHAICLSLIFKKDFYYILNKTYKRNSRITDLIKSVNIESKDITDEKSIQTSKINYDEVAKLLDIEIKKSKNILENIEKSENEKK